MMTSEMLHRTHLIDIKTRKLVTESFSGAYHSAFKGRGLEFDTIRPYEFGDDIRLIDWKSTARIGSPVVRQYIEERELVILLLVDASASCFYSTSTHNLMCEIAAVLAYSASLNGDRVGLLLFSDTIEHYVPPNKGRNHVLRLIRDLLTVTPNHKETDIAVALRTANRIAKKNTIMFLLSDFISPIDTYDRELSFLSFHHDVIGLIVGNPFQLPIGKVGLIRIRDAETGEIVWIDAQSKNWLSAYSQQTARFQRLVTTGLKQAKVDIVRISSSEETVPKLSGFFAARVRAGYQ